MRLMTDDVASIIYQSLVLGAEGGGIGGGGGKGGGVGGIGGRTQGCEALAPRRE
jgi:hypothetical protein